LSPRTPSSPESRQTQAPVPGPRRTSRHHYISGWYGHPDRRCSCRVSGVKTEGRAGSGH
jgi:hypothetical protein